ncbi:MAG: hypothetical protein HYT62_01715 [Candidatus Yanofskybacteria bacterium]|nr:hypothetical protein [Candidatus Yanofskybacteria bacterium]
MAQSGIELFFASFGSVKLSRDAPVLVFGFECQDDPSVAKYFPEMEARRKSIDKIAFKGDEMVTLQSILRDGKTYHAGLVYIPYPWRRKKEIRTASLNFLREVFCGVNLAVRRLKDEKFEKFFLVLPDRFSPQNVKDKEHREYLYYFVRMVVEAIIYSDSSCDDYKNKNDKASKLKEVTFLFFGKEDKAVDGFFKKAINDGEIAGSYLAKTRRLIEAPPNIQTPLNFVLSVLGDGVNIRSSDEWQEITMSPNLTAHLLLGKSALKSHGFELINAVNQGSRSEPCLLRIHYKPNTGRQKRIRKIVLVGKGVVFDTGGHDIKGTGYYDNMHFDMAGAATSMAIPFMAEEFNLPVEVITITPIVQNMIGSNSILPGSILRAYGGKTVKIVNTDCEGRLILAEAIAFGERKFKPDAIISVGTLSDLKDLGPDFLKVGYVGRGNRRKIEISEKMSSEKVFLMPEIENFNRVDMMHISSDSDLLNDIPSAYHTSPFVFLHNFFERETSWFFVDISAIFEADAKEYGAGPGFGQRFIWHLVQQYV